MSRRVSSMVEKNDKAEDAAIIGNAEADVALLTLCPDLPEWPQRWQMEPDDLLIGAQVVDVFRPFLRHLIRRDLAAKTLKNHRDNLWMLGGELIRRRHEEPELKGHSVSALIAELIDDETGPLIWPRISESAQDAFDVTCRQLHRFLSDTSAPVNKS